MSKTATGAKPFPPQLSALLPKPVSSYMQTHARAPHRLWAVKDRESCCIGKVGRILRCADM